MFLFDRDGQFIPGEIMAGLLSEFFATKGSTNELFMIRD